MTNEPKRKTFFITAKIEVVYETFAENEEAALDRFEEALDDEGERASIFEDASSLYDIVRVEDADTHFDNN
jgi:chlorite dismutase